MRVFALAREPSAPRAPADAPAGRCGDAIVGGNVYAANSSTSGEESLAACAVWLDYARPLLDE